MNAPRSQSNAEVCEGGGGNLSGKHECRFEPAEICARAVAARKLGTAWPTLAELPCRHTHMLR
eukprot:13822796-Alexandrium_andersonii.AAC.1